MDPGQGACHLEELPADPLAHPVSRSVIYNVMLYFVLGMTIDEGRVKEKLKEALCNLYNTEISFAHEVSVKGRY